MKRNAILLQEAYRRDGHADFIKRASDVCGVPRSTVKIMTKAETTSIKQLPAGVSSGIYLYPNTHKVKSEAK